MSKQPHKMPALVLPGASKAPGLTDWPAHDRRRIRGVLTDIDDTLTESGEIMPQALEALTRLHRAGLPVIAITGRPAGWSEPHAMQWPISGIVAENGAVALWRGTHGQLHKDWVQDIDTRRANVARLKQAAEDVLRQLPHARLSTDSAGRETDLAIDHAEHAHLDAVDIEQVCQILRAHGLTVTVSSIHINAWVGNHQKWSGACWALRLLLGIDLASEPERWVFIGDSTNDEIMFRHCPQSVAVANIAPHWCKLRHFPRYVTVGQRGMGFAEMTHALLDVK